MDLQAEPPSVTPGKRGAGKPFPASVAAPVEIVAAVGKLFLLWLSDTRDERQHTIFRWDPDRGRVERLVLSPPPEASEE